MKAYKVEVLVLDFDGYGDDSIVVELEDNNFSTRVMKIESADIGDWSDEHPLNYQKTSLQKYEELFQNKNNNISKILVSTIEEWRARKGFLSTTGDKIDGHKAHVYGLCARDLERIVENNTK